MEADWEVEIGGGAPVIEALWTGFPGSPGFRGAPGFFDLRTHPERIVEIPEAEAFPPLAALLAALNAPESPVWTCKCDLWEPEPAALASYIDVLPAGGAVFSEWQQAEAFCREYVARLEAVALPDLGVESRIDLVIRQAIVGLAEGFGITAYLSAAGADWTAAAGLAAVMASFADALPPLKPPAAVGSKLQ
jgi:hypothetical protein